MSNPLGDYLRSERNRSGASLGEVARVSLLSKAALSNIERGKHLPAKASYRKLAKGYQVDLDVIKEKANEASEPGERIDSKNQVRSILKSVSDGDNLIYIAQASYIHEDRKMVKEISDLLRRDALLTFVFYEPRKGRESGKGNSLWGNNHRYGAQSLLRGLTGFENEKPENVFYLILRKPTMDDCVFLKANEGTIFLSRRSRDRLEDSDAWSELDSKRGFIWQPRGFNFVSELHTWLAQGCGFDLRAPAIKGKREDVDCLNLVDFLSHG